MTWLNSFAPRDFVWKIRWIIFQLILVSDGWSYLLETFTRVNVTTGSDNDFVPPGIKPSPKPMLIQIYVTICRHWATIQAHPSSVLSVGHVGKSVHRFK